MGRPTPDLLRAATIDSEVTTADIDGDGSAATERHDQAVDSRR